MVKKSYPRVYYEMLIIGLGMVIGIGLYGSFLPLYAEGFEPSILLLSFVGAAWYITRAFVELPSSLIAIKFGRRNLMIIGLIFSSFGAILCALSNNIYMLIAGRATWGFGSALYFTCNTALLFDIFKRGKRGGAVGTFQSFETSGRFLAAPVGGLLAEVLGYNNVFLISSIIIAISAIIAFQSQSLKTADSTARKKFKKLTLKEIFVSFKSKNLLFISIVKMNRSLTMSGIMTMIFPLYFNVQLNFPITLIGLMIGIKTLVGIAGSFTAGHLSDKYGRKPFIIGGLMLDGFCFYLFTLISTVEQGLILSALNGISSGFVFGPLMVLMSDLAPISTRTAALGIFKTFMDVGGLLGPFIFIFIYYNLGVTTPFLAALILSFINIPIIILIRNKSNKVE